MSLYSSLTLLILISATFAYINHRFVKMPFVIGLFFLSTLFSVLIICSKFWDKKIYDDIRTIIEQTNISKFILDIMLGFLLFAGSLHTRWVDIKQQLKPIGLFAIGGVLASTIIIAALFYAICHALNLEIGFIHCLIFGALISPTDPIAVLGILTKANVPRRIESIIVGESLFNDGIGVVVFISLLDTLKLGTGQIDFTHFGTLFLQEAVGGILSGLLLGFILHKLLSSIDNYETEILLTLAFVMGGYALCNHFHLSGALAMVIMGLFIGNYRREVSMSDHTHEHVHKFWKLLDVILNAILFISIAFVLVVIDLRPGYIIISVVTIFIVLLSRIIVVYLPAIAFPKFTRINNKEARTVVWGGLRGGLSIALVLSLPESNARSLLIIATYFCVVFSILVQGLTIERVAKSS